MKIRITNICDFHESHGVKLGDIYDAEFVQDDGQCLQITGPCGPVIIDWPGAGEPCWDEVTDTNHERD